MKFEFKGFQIYLDEESVSPIVRGRLNVSLLRETETLKKVMADCGQPWIGITTDGSGTVTTYMYDRNSQEDEYSWDQEVYEEQVYSLLDSIEILPDSGEIDDSKPVVTFWQNVLGQDSAEGWYRLSRTADEALDWYFDRAYGCDTLPGTGSLRKYEISSSKFGNPIIRSWSAHLEGRGWPANRPLDEIDGKISVCDNMFSSGIALVEKHDDQEGWNSSRLKVFELYERFKA